LRLARGKLRRCAVGFDIVEMFAKPLDHGFFLPFIELALHFIEREMNDIVVMDFFSG
jgi:hypothetical protein